MTHTAIYIIIAAFMIIVCFLFCYFLFKLEKIMWENYKEKIKKNAHQR